jgi:hypothetical protein
LNASSFDALGGGFFRGAGHADDTANPEGDLLDERD